MKKVIFSIFASLLLILGCQNPSNSEPVIINYSNGTEQKTGMVSGTIILDGMQNDNKGFIITVAGTSLMATTNSKGEFCIANIPVGKNYEIVIIYGTYRCVWKTNVEVKKNKTNNLGSFEITTEEIKQNSDFQTYAISYELNGGSFTSTPDFVHLYGKTTQLPTPVKTGYGFIGWYTNEDFSSEKITSLSADFNSKIKLYAYWKSGLTVPGGVAGLNSFLESLSDVEINKIIITEDFPDLSVIVSALKNNSTKKVVLDLSLTSISIVNDSKFKDVKNLIGIELPESVISIGTSAFYGCSGLTSVTIPSSVTSIGTYAFSGCGNLTKVNITDLEAWCKISFSNLYSNPLYYAKHLYLNDVEITSLEIPNTVTSIGNYAFDGCSGLTSLTIPSSVTSISYSAFENCSGLTSVTIPSSVTSIGYDAFYNCNNIEEITIPQIMLSEEFSYFGINKESFKKVTILDGVTSIGEGVFSGCSSLTSVTIPSSVTSIGEDAFYGCYNLTKVNITDLEAWCKISFSDYSYNPLDYAGHLYLNDVEIASLEIPNTVTSIGDYAFYGCSGLTSVTIPSSVTSIGASAFYGCEGLTSVTIPSSVTSISNSAFSRCSGLAQITVDKNNPKYDSRDDCNGIIETSTNTLVLGCKNTIIPSSVTSIGASAFSGCEGLTSVTIPSSVTSIGNYAFSGCDGLTSVTIPSSVTSIGSAVFSRCNGLTSVTIPSSVTSISNSAFSGCNALTSLEIPNTVTSIGDYAFHGCSGLTSVTIPSSVTSIGYDAFYGCTKLQTITFEDTTTWYRTYYSSDWRNKTGGTQTDVSSPTTNATNFKSNYNYYYWYKL